MYTPSNLWLGGAEGLRPQPAASNASATRATTRKTRPAIFIHSHLALSTRRGRSTASPPPQPLLYDTEACSSVLVSVNTGLGDRKSTRLNSSHVRISYAVFCLKKK